MNPRPVAGRGIGPGWMLGTKHLFGEHSGSSAVCLRQLFPQRPIFPPTRTSCSDWLRVRDAVASSTPQERRQQWRQLEFGRRERVQECKSSFLLFTPQLQMNLQTKRGGRDVCRSGWKKASEAPWETERFVPIYSPIYLRLLKLNYRKVNVEETDPSHVRESDLIFPPCQHVYPHYLVIFVMYRWSRCNKVILHGETPMMESSHKCWRQSFS